MSSIFGGTSPGDINKAMDMLKSSDVKSEKKTVWFQTKIQLSNGESREAIQISPEDVSTIAQAAKQAFSNLSAAGKSANIEKFEQIISNVKEIKTDGDEVADSSIDDLQNTLTAAKSKREIAKRVKNAMDQIESGTLEKSEEGGKVSFTLNGRAVPIEPEDVALITETALDRLGMMSNEARSENVETLKRTLSNLKKISQGSDPNIDTIHFVTMNVINRNLAKTIEEVKSTPPGEIIQEMPEGYIPETKNEDGDSISARNDSELRKNAGIREQIDHQDAKSAEMFMQAETLRQMINDTVVPEDIRNASGEEVIPQAVIAEDMRPEVEIKQDLRTVTFKAEKTAIEIQKREDDITATLSKMGDGEVSLSEDTENLASELNTKVQAYKLLKQFYTGLTNLHDNLSKASGNPEEVEARPSREFPKPKFSEDALNDIVANARDRANRQAKLRKDLELQSIELMRPPNVSEAVVNIAYTAAKNIPVVNWFLPK